MAILTPPYGVVERMKCLCLWNVAKNCRYDIEYGKCLSTSHSAYSLMEKTRNHSTISIHELSLVFKAESDEIEASK